MSLNLTRQETANRAAAIQLHSYAITLDLRDSRDIHQPTFPARSAIRLTSQQPETWVDYAAAAVTVVMIDGKIQPVEFDGARVQLRNLPVGQECNVVIEGASLYSSSGEGMHRFQDPADGQIYLYTQYEPSDARRVFPCFEQPDMKATFAFTVIGPEEWTLLSNQPEKSREPGGEGMQCVEFEETPRMSTFITCVCAGDWHRVADHWQAGDDASPIPLALYCRQSLSKYLDHDELFRVTKAGLDRFQDVFGDYVWGKYDQLFAPEYNLGAMENPGLVTFNEHLLFRSKATPAQYQSRANTVLHEMSHMWFGDLVTPRWWSDLWLKESFAEFMGAHMSLTAAGFDDAWLNFTGGRKAAAYDADNLPTTHPIVADIEDLEAAKNNYDRITYSKGASALTQLVHWVGLEDFFAGCRLFFARHEYGNATLEDFLTALSQASGKDLQAWSRAWLQTSGHDALSMQLENADGTLTRALLRRSPAGDAKEANRPHATTVGIYDLDQGRLGLRERVAVKIDSAETTVPELAGSPTPALVLPNDTDQTFARVVLGPAEQQVLLAHAGDLEPLPRAVGWFSLRTDVRESRLTPQDFIAAAKRQAPAEDRPGIRTALINDVGRMLRNYVRPEERAVSAAPWRDVCLAAAQAAAPGSAAQLQWAKAYLAAAALAPRDVRGVLSGEIDGLEISDELRWQVLQSLATQGEVTEAELAAALADDPSASGRIAHLRAHYSRPEAHLKQEAWRRIHVVAGETNEAVDALLAAVFAQGDSPLADEFAVPYFENLRQVWQEHQIEIARRLVILGYPRNPAHLPRSEEWLTANQDAPPALRRLVLEADAELRIADRVRRA